MLPNELISYALPSINDFVINATLLAFKIPEEIKRPAACGALHLALVCSASKRIGNVLIEIEPTLLGFLPEASSCGEFVRNARNHALPRTEVRTQIGLWQWMLSWSNRLPHAGNKPCHVSVPDFGGKFSGISAKTMEKNKNACKDNA